MLLALSLFISFSSAHALDSLQVVTTSRRLLDAGLRECKAFDMLKRLTSSAPHRLSGSEGAAKAVDVIQKMLAEVGAVHIRAESLMVPRWVRGNVEKAVILRTSRRPSSALAVCALGGSVGTPAKGITAQVVEVKSFDELHLLGTQVAGKIVFFNRPMDPTKLNTFTAYGEAVDQRSRGAVEAAKMGAVGVLVRSITLSGDDVPHTGSTGYAADVPKIPAAAVSITGANRLSALLRQENTVRVRLTLSCQTLPDVPSANVMGELVGIEKPDEIILVGGHLDCWDKGSGAHDAGAGCVQAIEVLRLFQSLGIAPRRTIRAVMFMNEENGSRGGKAYAANPRRMEERTIAALESDRGGFAPRGLSIQADSTTTEKVTRWKSFFERLDAGALNPGHAGVDVSPIIERGAAGFGLIVENHRYFDYHHSDNDTIDKVNPRELEMGAIVETLLCYLLSEEGL